MVGEDQRGQFFRISIQSGVYCVFTIGKKFQKEIFMSKLFLEILSERVVLETTR